MQMSSLLIVLPYIPHSLFIGIFEGWYASRICIESTAVMDVFPSEARSGIPSELLYADGLVLLAPIMEPPGRRLAEKRVRPLDKGQKVNAGMYEVMVGSSDGKIIVNSGK